MSDVEQIAWDERYRQGSHSSRQPDPFLIDAYDEFIHPLFPGAGAALDLAGGVGRHAIFLAQRGWRVTLTDISPVGIQRARHAAEKRRVQIDFLTADARHFSSDKAFDLVLVFFYLERELFPAIASALRPGGLVVYKTYTCEHERFSDKGLSHPMYFLRPNELLRAFPGFRVLYYRETVREKGIAELVACKAQDE
jgi:SAM-dependent methyltransferase